MSNLSINSQSKFLLDFIRYNAPEEWEDVNITASFEDHKNEPNLAIEDFTFNLEARQAILNWIEAGKTGGVGIFEGMPFSLTLFNNQPIQSNFNAFLDFTNGFRDLVEDGRVDVGIVKDNGVNHFLDQIGGISFGVLESEGNVTQADYVTVEYIVEKKFNLLELLQASIILFIMVKELAESVKRAADAIKGFSSLSAIPPTGSIGAVVFAILDAIIIVAYTAVLLVAVIDMTRTMINSLVPPIREHKAITLRRALEVVCTRFGYNLDAPIAELDFIHYLPSNPRLDDKDKFGFISAVKGTPTGIPNVLDYGYNCSEMFELAINLFKAKIDIVGNKVILRPENDPFWFQQSVWNFNNKAPLLEVKEYNTEELVGDRLLTFVTDVQDEWTIDNYIGTSYEIRTDPDKVLRQRAVLVKGFEEVNFRVALGNRKDELNAIENLLLKVANLVDKVTKALDGGTSFGSKISSKVGMLKQSNNYHTVPKLLYISGGSIPQNHRDLFKAKTLWDNYHVEGSFVSDNWYGQKTVYNGVNIPFGFEDYKLLLENSYFNYKGSVAKIINFDWITGQDRATISFWVREPYTFNLKETFIEPS